MQRMRVESQLKNGINIIHTSFRLEGEKVVFILDEDEICSAPLSQVEYLN